MAIFVTAGGGTLGDSISTAEIEDGAVTNTKIALSSEAQGDIMYRGGTNWDRLAAGSSGDILTSNGAAANPAWSGTVAITSGGTGQTSATAAFDALGPGTTKGDVLVHNGTDHIRLAVGTNAHVLTADSAEASGVKWSATGAGDALVANPLSQFAATTSAQLAGVISNETGSGALVFGTSPTLVTPVLGTPSSGALGSCTAYEGTAVASTGEAGGTKFLREDGDGTCSWQATPSASSAAWTELATSAPSASTSENFTSLAAHDEYMVVYNFEGSTDQDIWFRIGDDAGTNYNYYNEAGGSSTAQTGIKIAQTQQSVSNNRAVYGVIFLAGKLSANADRIQISNNAGTTNTGGQASAGNYDSGTNGKQVDQVNIVPSTGNITGTIAVFGRSIQ